MTKFEAGDLVIVVHPTSDYFMNEIVEVLFEDCGMVEVKLLKDIMSYKAGETFSWFKHRVKMASECHKCKHACKMREKCSLYEE